MNHVIEADTSAEMRENIHETVGSVSITTAKCHLLTTQVKHYTNIIEHINNLQEQQYMLINMGECISDQEFKSISIMSLSDTWESFTSSYQGSNTKWLQGLQQPQAQMSSQELLSILIQEYYHHHQDDNNSNVSYSAQQGGPPKKKRKFNSSSSTPKPKCKICGYQNHLTKNCCFKGKLKCGKCRKFSHKTEDCWC
jgi:gag-polypeptide of LTR copia-type